MVKYDRYAIHLAFIESKKTFLVSQKLLQMNKSEISALPYMHPGRVDVISAGALVLSQIIERTKVSGFIAAETDILDGIAWSIAK